MKKAISNIVNKLERNKPYIAVASELSVIFLTIALTFSTIYLQYSAWL